MSVEPMERRARRRRTAILLAVAITGGLFMATLPTPAMQWSSVSALDSIGPGALDVSAAEVPDPSDADAVVVEAVDIADFDLVGLRYPATDESPDAHGHAQVRVRSVDGEWGEWLETEVPVDEGPDPLTDEAAASALVTTDPIWVDDADAVQVAIDGEVADEVEVLVVREHIERSVVDNVGVAEAATPATANGPTIRTRSEWGARSVSGLGVASQIEMGVVHHTASTSDYSSSQVPGILRGIQAYHIDGNGWSDIGYNFLVDRFGTIWEGRAGGTTKNVIGAHAAGFNTGSFGVSVIGSFDGTVPTQASVNAVSALLGWRLYLADRDPTGSVVFTSGGSSKYSAGAKVNLSRVIGHRDVGLTGCPGSNLYARLGEIRSRAKTAYDSYAVHDPKGAVIDRATYPGLIGVGGYVFDPDSTAAIKVDVSVDGRVVATQTADKYRAGTNAVKPGWGDNHGFLVHVAANPGARQVCVTAKNTGLGRDVQVFCGSLTVPDDSPLGNFSAVAVAGRVTVTGSVTDPDASGATEVTTRLAGQPGGVLSQVRSANPTFSASFDSVPGTHDLCVYAKNRNEGSDVTIGCQKLTVRSGSPFGSVDTTTAGTGKVTLTGWALDPDTASAVDVIARINGQPGGSTSVRMLADRPRTGVNYYFPGYGDQHGFEVVVPSTAGTHDLCVYAINAGAGGDTTLSCQRVVVK